MLKKAGTHSQLLGDQVQWEAGDGNKHENAYQHSYLNNNFPINI